VRELKNVVERAIILSRDKSQIRVEHLAIGSGNHKKCAKINLNFDHDPSLEELEAAYLEMQLKKFSGRRAKVAEVLNISERNVYRLIKRYELSGAQ
jgi:DNA-binding NtrC family response regulator